MRAGNEPWKITLLGGLRAERGEQVVTRFKSRKAGALLAYLACHQTGTQPREALIALFWPEAAPRAGRNSLSVALWSLRHQLEPPDMPAGAVVRADRFSVGLNPAMVTTNVADFEVAIRAAAKAENATERAQCWTRAVEGYAGPLLPGFYEEWIAGEQERLAGLFRDAVGGLIAHLEAASDWNTALCHARHAVAVDRFREEGHLHLIRLLAASGQPSAALSQFKAWERILGEDTGEEPSAALRALARQIERQAGLTPPAAAPLAPQTPARPAAVLPPLSDTATLLMADIEDARRLRERAGEAFAGVRETYRALLRREFARLGGQEINPTDDAFLVAFGSARRALECAVSCQRALAGAAWPALVGAPGVRMALYTGEASEHSPNGDDHGPARSHVARMLTAARGGQILVAEATAALVRGNRNDDMRLADLGVYRLRDAPAPERLFQAEYPDRERREFGPPAAAEAGYPANLPLQLTRFFGRDEEIGQLTDRLRATPRTRVTTLTGPGGTGKTRLALQVAERLAGDFDGAVYFAPLANLSDPRRIAGTVLDALRVPHAPQSDPLDQAADELGGRPALLVLDNFEHLIADGGVPVVQALLARVPSVTILVTARQLLGLSGECEFALSPLPTPDGGETPERLSLFDSVRLFVDRAQAAQPHFQVTERNSAAVAELCRRLEGIPLALELAAARVLVLTPVQMLAQWEQRSDFLISRKRDVSERHRTLRAAMDWSYRLLAPELQRFFARLSVFRGGWTAEAAEAVCEEPLALDYLTLLRERSLVATEHADSETRFRMLKTLREFAEERLTTEERDELRSRHVAYYLQLAEVLSAGSRADYKGNLHRSDNERDNYHAVLEWSRTEANDEATTIGARLAVALWWYWIGRSQFAEGFRWLFEALARNKPERNAAWARLLYCAAHAAHVHIDDNARATALLEECLDIRRDLGDPAPVAEALQLLGVVLGHQKDFAVARARLEESISVKRALGNKDGVAESLNSLSWILWELGEDELAISCREENLALAREVSDPVTKIRALQGWSSVTGGRGDYGTCRSVLREAIIIASQIEDRRQIMETLTLFVELAEREGQAERATRLCGAADALSSVLKNPSV